MDKKPRPEAQGPAPLEPSKTLAPEILKSSKYKSNIELIKQGSNLQEVQFGLTAMSCIVNKFDKEKVEKDKRKIGAFADIIDEILIGQTQSDQQRKLIDEAMTNWIPDEGQQRKRGIPFRIMDMKEEKLHYYFSPELYDLVEDCSRMSVALIYGMYEQFTEEESWISCTFTGALVFTIERFNEIYETALPGMKKFIQFLLQQREEVKMLLFFNPQFDTSKKIVNAHEVQQCTLTWVSRITTVPKDILDQNTAIVVLTSPEFFTLESVKTNFYYRDTDPYCPFEEVKGAKWTAAEFFADRWFGENIKECLIRLAKSKPSDLPDQRLKRSVSYHKYLNDVLGRASVKMGDFAKALIYAILLQYKLSQLGIVCSTFGDLMMGKGMDKWTDQIKPPLINEDPADFFQAQTGKDIMNSIDKMDTGKMSVLLMEWMRGMLYAAGLQEGGLKLLSELGIGAMEIARQKSIKLQTNEAIIQKAKEMVSFEDIINNIFIQMFSIFRNPEGKIVQQMVTYDKNFREIARHAVSHVRNKNKKVTLQLIYQYMENWMKNNNVNNKTIYAPTDLLYPYLYADKNNQPFASFSRRRRVLTLQAADKIERTSSQVPAQAPNCLLMADEADKKAMSEKKQIIEEQKQKEQQMELSEHGRLEKKVKNALDEEPQIKALNLKKRAGWEDCQSMLIKASVTAAKKNRRAEKISAHDFVIFLEKQKRGVIIIISPYDTAAKGCYMVVDGVFRHITSATMLLITQQTELGWFAPSMHWDFVPFINYYHTKDAANFKQILEKQKNVYEFGNSFGLTQKQELEQENY